MTHVRVLIIGGGFGGLSVAKALKKARLDLLLIDKTNHHLFQPLLYEVATAGLSPGEIATPIREILRTQENATVVMGEVVSIDKDRKAVTLANGDEITCDFLIVAVGSHHSYFGNDHWEACAPGLKTINDALKLRGQLLLSFEKAERLDCASDSAPFLNFVIIGGGPTGVEMAGAIAEIAYKTMFKNFRRIKPERANIFLIEAASHLLPTYAPRLSMRAQRDLEKMGVRVITGKKVTDIHEGGVQVEELFIASKNVIWAAGNQASSLLKTLGTPLDRQGRAIVGPDLALPNHPHIFIIGDAACATGKKGMPLPAIASAAVQQGRYVAKIIQEALPPEKRKPFSYFDKGMMAAIGKSKAVVQIKKLHFTGFFAWILWCFVHIAYLVGFRNRFGVLLEWFFCWITGQRGVRLIYQPIDTHLPKKPPR